MPAEPTLPPDPHLSPAAAVADQLGVDPQHGLTDPQVEERRIAHGPNLLAEAVNALSGRGVEIDAVALRQYQQCALATFGSLKQTSAPCLVGIAHITARPIGNAHIARRHHR